jgi:hypothetical protein
MPAMQLAAAGIEPLVLRVHRYAGAAFRGVRHGMEHVLNQGALSRLQSPVEMDLVPSLRRVVVTCRLVRTERASALKDLQRGDKK